MEGSIGQPATREIVARIKRIGQPVMLDIGLQTTERIQRWLTDGEDKEFSIDLTKSTREALEAEVAYREGLATRHPKSAKGL
ncbi:MAG: hypothetical protein AAB573_00580 [Patescibacteria group bacterium]